MKIRSVALYHLELPLAQAFSHSAKHRTVSDALIARVESDQGVVGFGEGAPRPYVTGETLDSAIACVASQVWPALRGTTFPALRATAGLALISRLIPTPPPQDRVRWHASRCAVELALLDCLLREAGIGLAELLPARRQRIRYSGVIGTVNVEEARRLAHQMKLAGLSAVKIKVGSGDDVARLGTVREVCGPEVSLRVDANGAWSVEEAASMLAQFEPYQIDAVEEPIASRDPEALRSLKQQTAIPIVVDESLVSVEDARVLVEAGACDIFNIRISKCGGLAPSLDIAEVAHAHGVQVQVGAHVGETAVLSAVGRHFAAAIPEVRFMEGSFGTYLLTEDVSQEDIAFGHGGEAQALSGPGYGITVQEPVLAKYATRVVQLGVR
jgi:muconate cycloisomerase